jgi:hypothetical protein
MKLETNNEQTLILLGGLFCALGVAYMRNDVELIKKTNELIQLCNLNLSE